MVQVTDDHGRLAKLRGLRQHVDAEIRRIEERAARIERLRERPVLPVADDTPRKPPAPHRTDVLLQQLGVTAAVVRAWAIDQDLTTPGKRGRIAADLVEQYATAHPHQEAGTA